MKLDPDHEGCACGGSGKVIAYPGDAPPRVVNCPMDYRGMIWSYDQITGENKAKARAIAARDFPDWVPDPELAEDGAEGFEKAEKQDFGDADSPRPTFMYDVDGGQERFDIGEQEKKSCYHPWRSIVEGQDDVIRLGLEEKPEYCTFMAAWDALGRPTEFLLNGGNGSLFMRVEVNEPTTMEVRFWDDSGADDYRTVRVEATAEDIESEAQDWVSDGDWGEKCLVSVSWEILDGPRKGDEGRVSVEAGDDPEPPECAEDQEHDWCSPEWLGGCKENPGVWSLGGARISVKKVCRHCGAYQKYESGEDGRTPDKTTYEEADEGSLAWVERENRQ